MRVYTGYYHEFGDVVTRPKDIADTTFNEEQEYEVETEYYDVDGIYRYSCYGRDYNKMFNILNDIRIETLKNKIAELEELLKEAEEEKSIHNI